MQQMLRHVRTSAAVVRRCCVRALLCSNLSSFVTVATCAAALLRVWRLPRASRLDAQLCSATQDCLTFSECEGFSSGSAASSLLQLRCAVTALV